MADIPESTKLLPCPNPWCENIRGVEAARHITTAKWHICCGDCLIDGPWSDTCDLAIAAWNTRAAPPAMDREAVGMLPAAIGRVHLGERRSDGERLCSHGHAVPAGHPLYWPERMGEYPDDVDPLCLGHAIDQAVDDNSWCEKCTGEELEAEGTALREDWLRGDWYEKWQDATENADEGLMATLEELRGRIERTIVAALSTLSADAIRQGEGSEVERFREAIVTIIGRCEALEDEASDELAKDQADHAHGFYRGQKSIAKSLRRHLADLARPITPASHASDGGEGA